jgi:NADH:ubiquinone oxidoreductase subunit 4 (chain M)
MGNIYELIFLPSLFKYNFFLLFFGIFFSLIVWYFSKFFNFQFLFKNYSSSSFVKLILASTLLASFIIHSLSFWVYIKFFFIHNNSYIFDQNLFFEPNLFFYKNVFFSFFSLKFSIEFFGYIFIILAYIVSIISFLCLDSQFYYKNMRFIFICNFLVLVIYLFTITTDFLFFFLLYESLMIPSFLFVYYTSTYKRGIQASLYFLIWTQLGSFLVLCAISYIISITGSTSFNALRYISLTSEEIWFIYFLIFLGFGFKIPIWPFHYWLTKTHVEAPAGFSIFLSGFLVKSAIYGFYRISNLLGGSLDTSFFSIFAVMGVLDASFKMWGQIDLKKLVAYCTIQEMSLLYLVFIWGDTLCFIGGVMLCITHALLSPLMFFLVDCIQRRYKSRLVSEISGIIHTTPNLGIALIIMVVLYSGLPGTIKFVSELYIYAGLMETAPFTCLLLLFGANFFGLIGFSKCWFNVIFGLSMKNQDKLPVDLNFKEIFIICLCVGLSFVFTSIFNIII